MSEGASTLQPPDEDARRAQALRTSARPLIALATQLRRAVLEAPEGMKRALAAAVARFERELAAAGWDERGIVAASYVLCTWVDEVAADTPWGAGGAGLLERFHGERDGSAKVLRLLSRLAEQPRENRALLELFHTCLSLGLKGPLRADPDGARQLDTLRSRVWLALPHDELALSPAWHGAVPAAPPAWRRRLALGALLLLGLVAIAVYSTGLMRLAERVDAVFASMQKLSSAGPAGGAAAAPVTAGPAGPAAPGGPAVAAAAPPVARLAPLLADDLAAGRLRVRDEAHRSVVSLPAAALFAPGSTQPSSAGAALLARVGAALARQGGKVLVVGHTDGRDARSARLPSAWHQSYEWAREAADALGRTLPAERLAVEGAADLDDAGDAAVPRRRVDVVLYP